MAKETYINPQLARRLCPVVPDPVSKDASDIVEYVRKDKVRKIGDGEDDFVVEEVVVEASRVNRQAYIMKDADQVGIMNILEKVRRSGDVTLLNQTGAIIPEGVQDYTNVPSNTQEALAALEKGGNSFEALKAIFGDTSFEALANMSADELAAAVQNYVDKNQQEKGEEQ